MRRAGREAEQWREGRAGGVRLGQEGRCAAGAGSTHGSPSCICTDKPHASTSHPSPQVPVRRFKERHHVLQQHRLQLTVVRLLLLQGNEQW